MGDFNETQIKVACLISPVPSSESDVCTSLPTLEEMQRGTLYWQPGLDLLTTARERLIQTLAEIQAPTRLSSEDQKRYFAAVVLVKLAQQVKRTR